MLKIVSTLTTAALLGASLAACSGSGGTVLTPYKPFSPNTQYTQIELLSRPAIKEVLEPFIDHQKTNAAEPYNDPTIQADIATTEDALRPPNTTAGTDYGATLAKVLYPNAYTVNLNGASPTAANADPYFFLSEVADGATYFGGRAPNDDVVDLELGILFGNTLSKLGVLADDGEENNCISSQNIGGQGMFVEDPSKVSTTTFPYLPAPH